MSTQHSADVQPPWPAWLLWPYQFLWLLMLPFVLIRMWWRGRAVAGYRHHWAERFGWQGISEPVDIWWHAVSVGELIASVPTLKALKAQYPQLRIAVSVTTPTGRACAQERLPVFQIFYAPFDMFWPVRAVFRRLQPRCLVLMETELWPQLLTQAHYSRVPVIVANARLSERSARGYARLPKIEYLLKGVHTISAQSQSDALRFVALGALETSVVVGGNLKFDVPDMCTQISQGKRLRESWQRSNVWMAASTHQGEESQVLSAHQAVQAQFPKALLVLVPRHPDRFQTVADAIVNAGFSLARRSLGQEPDSSTDVYLADTMGELSMLMPCCDMVFVGGSLVEHGGHNLLEPAQAHVPMLTGPHTHNFTHIHQLLEASKGVLTVRSSNELSQQVMGLFNDSATCSTLVQGANQVLAQNRGAQSRLLELITSVLCTKSANKDSSDKDFSSEALGQNQATD